MQRAAALVAVSLLLLSLPAAAQIVEPGITWSGTSGGIAGIFGFQCTPIEVAVTPGETVSLGIWGDYQAPYVIFASWSTGSCGRFPGIANMLVLDEPISLVGTGFLNNMTTWTNGPTGFEDITSQVSPSLPSGTSLTIQVVTLGSGIPAFTTGLTSTAL